MQATAAGTVARPQLIFSSGEAKVLASDGAMPR